MLSNYISFNAARFVKDYYKIIEIVDGLKKQLHDIDYIRSVPTDSDKVQTTPTGDQVERLVLRRIAIEERIKDYEWHIKTYEKAYSYLQADEKKVIDEFFTHTSKTDAVASLEQVGISRSRAYEIRKQALEKLSNFIAGVTL